MGVVSDYCTRTLQAVGNGQVLSPLQRSLLPGLRALSLPYGLGVSLRNIAYDLGWLRRAKAPLPIISIGNITAGGTSKTPFTAFLARELCQTRRVAILSRGYRSTAERSPHPVVVSVGDGPLVSVEDCGDEPYWLATQLPGCIVIAGRCREHSAVLAQKLGAECALLDDGMQHRQLERSFEIVLVNAQSPLGGGYLLPRGLLREPPRALKRADLLVISKAYDPERVSYAELLLRRWSSAPIIHCRLDAEAPEDITLAGLKAVGFCGLGDPDDFYTTLQRAGVILLERHSWPDHCVPSVHALGQLAIEAKARGADCLLCTEKDRVKLQHLPPLPLPLYAVPALLWCSQTPTGWIQAHLGR
ncbi:MAG: tetraacyldisaccharide 4'-kinase [Chlamydiia bacterium]|nr:tetraacyldisaccharide 4'-kinase [Chlamydiia bacterium]